MVTKSDDMGGNQALAALLRLDIIPGELKVRLAREWEAGGAQVGTPLGLAFKLRSGERVLDTLTEVVQLRSLSLNLAERPMEAGAPISAGQLRYYRLLGVGMGCLAVADWVEVLNSGTIEQCWVEPEFLAARPVNTLGLPNHTDGGSAAGSGAESGPAKPAVAPSWSPGSSGTTEPSRWDAGMTMQEDGPARATEPPASGPAHPNALLRHKVEKAISELLCERLPWPEFWELARRWYPGKLWARFYAGAPDADSLIRLGIPGEVTRPYRHLPVVELALPAVPEILGLVERQLRSRCVELQARFEFASPLAAPADAAVIHPARFFALERLGGLGAGRGVVVGILDTGLDLHHPDLSHLPRGWVRDFTDDGGAIDWDGHGTHCASVIVGKGRASYSLAPEAGLRFGKVFAQDGHGSMASILAALEWMAEEEVDVLSLSIGNSESPNGRGLLTSVCDHLAEAYGIVVVAAAGNSGPALETIQAPADGRAVLAVGACDRQRQLARFSSRGAAGHQAALTGKPDLVGPGVNVLGARARMSEYRATDASGLHTALSGTSMAAPAVAGFCALLCGACLEPDRPRRRLLVQRALIESCHPMAHPGGRPYASKYETGAGIPDLAKAVASLSAVGVQPLGSPPAHPQEPPLPAPVDTGDRDGEIATITLAHEAGGPAFREDSGKTLRAMEEDILGRWDPLVRERLPKLAASLFGVKPGWLGPPEVAMEWKETGRTSELKDLAARHGWPRAVLGRLPAGRLLTARVSARGAVLGGLRLEFALDFPALGRGEPGSPAACVDTVLAADPPGELWLHGIAGCFGPGPIPRRNRCHLVWWQAKQARWETATDPAFPALAILLHEESDAECRARVLDYLADRGRTPVLAIDAAEAAGITIPHLALLAGGLNGWRWREDQDGTPFLTYTH